MTALLSEGVVIGLLPRDKHVISCLANAACHFKGEEGQVETEKHFQDGKTSSCAPYVLYRFGALCIHHGVDVHS